MTGKSKRPARGRPRDPRLRQQILAAAHRLLNAGGLAAVTMDAIAQEAGVSKPTIYRDWPNAQAVAMAAFLAATTPPAPTSTNQPVLERLAIHLRRVAKEFSSPSGRSTALMIAAAQQDSELAKTFRNNFIMKSREEGRTLLQLAVSNGEVRDDIDMEAALDAFYAPLYFRLLIGHGALDAAFTDAVVNLVLNGLIN